MLFSDYKKHKDAKFNPALLWEYNLNNFDWNEMRGLVVERVIERGSMEDYYAMLNFYGGFENVKEIVAVDVPFLRPSDFIYVETLFNLDKKDLKCYKRQQLRKQLLSY
jgi:hypothetical protein